MEYKDSAEEPEDIDLTAEDIPLDEGDLEFEESFGEETGFEFEQLTKKAKAGAGGRFSLKARRAIEEHLEQRRLRKETDYLFDDEFAEENSEENNKKP